jgi:hypothetical protein
MHACRESPPRGRSIERLTGRPSAPSQRRRPDGKVSDDQRVTGGRESVSKQTPFPGMSPSPGAPVLWPTPPPSRPAARKRPPFPAGLGASNLSPLHRAGWGRSQTVELRIGRFSGRALRRAASSGPKSIQVKHLRQTRRGTSPRDTSLRRGKKIGVKHPITVHAASGKEP